MNVLGLTIARTKSLDLQHKTALASLQVVRGWRGWSHLFHEITTGGWQRNEEINIDTALSNPTLYSCITLIASDMGKLRPMLVEQDKDRIWEEIDQGKGKLVLEKPNNYQTWSQYVEWYMRSKLVFGNAYVLKRRDDRGVVNALYVIDPCRVLPLIAPDGSVFYQLNADSMDPAPIGDASIVVPAREIIHDVCVPLFSPLVGVSPIFAAGFPALQGLNILNASDKFFKNGSRPGGVLLVPGTLTQIQADEMKTNWKSAFSGDNQGDIAVLTGGMKYEPMAMTAEQARLVEQLQMTYEDICKCFHMPRYKVQVGPDPTYTNIEALNRNYYTDCLQAHIVNFQVLHTQGLELDNVPGKTLAVELDLDDLLMMDTAAKADAASKAVTAGLSYNEARLRFWDAGPVKGGESPMAQQQNFSLEALARRDEAMPAPASTAAALPPAPAEDVSPAEKSIDLVTLQAMVQRKVLELAA